MIFVPFTGVDHHKKCITFGAGLIANESVESYQWLLQCFVQTYPKAPSLVLTDQDPAMLQAVESVFKNSSHRLCMWHIMKKLPAKFPGDFLQSTDFRARLHKLVWNVFISPTTFEKRWIQLITEFKLATHVWLRDMYQMRHRWIPAYFRDIQMCCLMKTTSRCESSNSIFKVNSSPGNTLVQFLFCFDTSIDRQRYNQRLLEHKSYTTKIPLRTPLLIEKHALEVYTQEIFLEVQKEIQKGMVGSFITNVESNADGLEVFTVHHADKKTIINNSFTVTVDIANKKASCSCRGFTRIGYLCRHVFAVYRLRNVQEIPDEYE
ncbi:hypothetical protein QVD17_15128 [Tagetes erecta]|uniref:Protein FAR1-RELATED SEQUENCE n=1 Tax=Tagetes erecta TaxID=13708 RepID=A0AAD8KSS1_TARER|nr:hypothetical protein QVD17_15128 [Tagetes erecta]